MRLRSPLFAPGDSERKAAKALASDADAVILDLEDSVAAVRQGRGAGHRWRLCCRASARPGVVVRVNPPRHAVVSRRPRRRGARAAGRGDAAEMRGRGRPRGARPSSGGAGDRRRACAVGSDRRAADRDRDGSRGVLALDEMRAARARACWRSVSAPRICPPISASTRAGRTGSYPARGRAGAGDGAAGGRGRGVAALDTPWPDPRDPAGLAREAAAAAADGFAGKLCIHPDQIGPVNAAFTPAAGAGGVGAAGARGFAANPGAGRIRPGWQDDRPAPSEAGRADPGRGGRITGGNIAAMGRVTLRALYPGAEQEEDPSRRSPVSPGQWARAAACMTTHDRPSRSDRPAPVTAGDGLPSAPDARRTRGGCAARHLADGWRGRRMGAIGGFAVLYWCSADAGSARTTRRRTRRCRSASRRRRRRTPRSGRRAEWWKGFGSPELDTLIAGALADNTDIQAAIARVAQADARADGRRRAAAADRQTRPARTSWNRSSPAQPDHRPPASPGSARHQPLRRDPHLLGRSATRVSYELDFWGRLRASRDAAAASAAVQPVRPGDGGADRGHQRRHHLVPGAGAARTGSRSPQRNLRRRRADPARRSAAGWTAGTAIDARRRAAGGAGGRHPRHRSRPAQPDASSRSTGSASWSGGRRRRSPCARAR